MMAPLTIGLGKLRLHASRDSSAERALEISELRYRRLFETAQDGILILDGNTGKIIDANPFLLDLLDYPFESIIGRELWEIGLFEDIDANKAAFAKLQTEEYIRYENHPLRTKSGKVVAVEFVSNVYFVGPEKVIQCNIRDISQRSEIQAAANNRVAAREIATAVESMQLGGLAGMTALTMGVGQESGNGQKKSGPNDLRAPQGDDLELPSLNRPESGR